MTITKKFILVAILFAFNHAYAQINDIWGIAKEIKTTLSKRQKEKLAQEYLKYFDVDNQRIAYLRIPNDKISGEAQNYIIATQNDLENAKTLCLSGKPTKLDIYKIQSSVRKIRELDKDWVIIHYETEISFYDKWDKNLIDKEQKEKLRQQIIQDSIDRVIYLQNIKTKDSLKQIQKQQEDSIAYVERTKGFHFVNQDQINLYSSASEKSKVIGVIYSTSYVKILGKPNQKGLVKVQIRDYEGYVYQKYLVDNLDKITVSNADIKGAKEATREIMSVQQPEEYIGNSSGKSSRGSGKANRVGSGIYHRGPKGGCYYYSSSGKKVYVDRSLCN